MNRLGRVGDLVQSGHGCPEAWQTSGTAAPCTCCSMESQAVAYRDAGAVALQHLTGPCRGRATWLSGDEAAITLDHARFPHVVSHGEADIVATFARDGDTYRVVAPDAHAIWVNGRRVESHRLADRDLIEFGDEGPLSRFRIYREERPLQKPAADILRDGLVYLKVSRKPLGRRLGGGLAGLGARLMGETTLLFRLGVVLALIVLAAVVYQQGRFNTLLREQVASETGRLDEVAAALSRARDEALTPADLNAFRDELGTRFTTAADRLEALEQRSDAAARVIKGARDSVVFLQGAYGFREIDSGLMLRHVVDEDGAPMVSVSGQPLLTTQGEGPVAERQFSGTAFVVGDGTSLVTNRHVARPWEGDAIANAMSAQALEPVMMQFLAYAPGRSRAGTVAVARVSREDDLALLRVTGFESALPVLALAEAPPDPGDEMIVLGYPTGLRSMVTQSGEAFVSELTDTGETDFWSVAQLLAARGHIVPLASRGIVGKATGAAIVYDAETTHGGSGGPVMNVDGEVAAVNTAILPEFGGANLGVPVARVKALLAANEPS